MSFFRKNDKNGETELIENKKNKKEVLENEYSTKSITIVGAGCEVMGDVILCGGIEIHGKIKGNINSGGAKVSVMEKGIIEGDVMAEYVSINGRVAGTCCAKNVEILQSGELNGVCCAEVFSIFTGGRFTGESKFSKSDEIKQISIIDDEGNV